MPVRVLIVNDDRLLLGGIKRLLAQFEIGSAVTTEEAIDLMEKQPFDAVLTDYRVPTINGVALLRKVAEAWPATRRYLMSGNAPERFAEHIDSSLVHHIFHKPIDVNALRSELARLASTE